MSNLSDSEEKLARNWGTGRLTWIDRYPTLPEQVKTAAVHEAAPLHLLSASSPLLPSPSRTATPVNGYGEADDADAGRVGGRGDPAEKLDAIASTPPTSGACGRRRLPARTPPRLHQVVEGRRRRRKPKRRGPGERRRTVASTSSRFPLVNLVAVDS